MEKKREEKLEFMFKSIESLTCMLPNPIERERKNKMLTKKILIEFYSKHLCTQ